MTKRIFLAEDNENKRRELKEALETAGHEIVIEAKSFDEAVAQIDKAVELAVEILVTDGWMPNKNDGPKLAAQLNRRIPTLMVASISSGWEGVWEDPNYDETNLHPTHGRWGIDAHGRQKLRMPDSYISWFRNPEEFATALEGLTFSLRNEEELARIEAKNQGKRLERE